jgi:hypothetical protein
MAWELFGDKRDRSATDDERRQIDSLRTFTLLRLRHIAEIRQTGQGAHTPPDWKLLSYSMYSVYQDCVALGLRSEATDILGPSPVQEADQPDPNH